MLSEAAKSKMEALADLVSSGDPLLAHRQLSFHCVLTKGAGELPGVSFLEGHESHSPRVTSQRPHL